jgi:LysM repeat protein
MPTQQELDRATAAGDVARNRQAQAARSLHELGQLATYTAQEGDTYESIADATGGDAEAIAAVNGGGAASTDASLLEPGTVLVLPVPEPRDEPDVAEDDLAGLSRADLNRRAAAAGVEHPEELPNKAAVIAAIEAEG